MIQDHDRSGWFGASDVGFIMGSWKTKTFEKWWMQKLGVNRDHFDNKYTLAGTHFEHKILESIGIVGLKLDEQVKLPALLLRVNYDGLTEDTTWECKTFQLAKGWKMPKKYWQQVQVQIFAKGLKKGKIVAYGLEEADYDNFLRPIDHRRIRIEDIPYDETWVRTKFLPRLRILADCLRKGVYPREEMLCGGY